MRNIAFFAAGLLLILVQANLFRVVGPFDARLWGWGFRVSGATPSLVLPLILFLGVHEPSMSRGALLTFALGYALDLFSSAPIGLFTFISVMTWWLARVAGVRLTTQSLLTQLSLAFVFALIQGGMVVVLLAIFGTDPERPVELGQMILPRAIATALLAPFIFRLAQRLHQSVTMVPRSSEGVGP